MLSYSFDTMLETQISLLGVTLFLLSNYCCLTKKPWFLTNIQCSLGLSPPALSPTSPIAKILVCPDFPRYTAKLSYRHPPQVFRHKSRKTNLNSPVSTTHNYLLTAVYWSVIMECQNWSSYTVIDLIVEGQNRWSGVLIRIITCIYFSSDYICTFNPEENL